MSSAFTELNSALQWPSHHLPQGQFVLIKDCLESEGSFLLFKFLQSYLSSDSEIQNTKNRNKKVCLVSFDNTYIHYASIAKKLGVNLDADGENGSFQFYNGLSSPYDWNGDELNSPLVGVTPLTALTDKSTCENQQNVSHIKHVKANVEDVISKIKTAFGDSEEDFPDCVLVDHADPILKNEKEAFEFFQALKQMTNSKKEPAIITCVHSDGGEKIERWIRSAEHRSDLIFSVSGLPTGYSKEVHGQVTVKEMPSEIGERVQPVTLHFKTFEHNIKFFSPGSKLS
eukprot:gb/GECH01007216.1/.p1 GENE.gb/GECH01007216.1/~~gb/GECH01007216.1/.p1  ORF type:complete len:285 (+),score=75.72 gb/GECH01007216.1/:1-855(+)